MTFIRERIMKGKRRYYLEESIRVKIGEVKKVSVYLKDYDPKDKKKIKGYIQKLKKKKEEALVSSASEYYKTDSIFTKETIKKIEQRAIEYKIITKNLTEKQWQDIIDRFTVNFTYESNALEGNSLTLKDVTFVLKEGKVPEGKDLREIYEALNTRTALQWIFGKKLPITEDTIIKLHKILVKETGVQTGYKRFPNFLLGRKTQTTAPEYVSKEMKNLIDLYNQNERIPPLQSAAMFHSMFEKIHPFEDGNGRVGRLLINIILLNNEYPPLIIRKTHRTSYFSALEAADNEYNGKIYRFLIKRYKETHDKFFKIYIKYIEGMEY